MQNSSSTTNLLFRRLAAFLYDCLLLIAIYFVVTAAVIPLNDGQAIQHWSYKLFLVLVAFIFFDWFWRHGGQTLGMRAWRIRLEGTIEEKITFKQSVHRFVVGFLAFGFTLFYMYGNTSQQALHDKISKTKIVKYYN
ncbi:MAG: RDD family protein [Granulosicoccus sp.]